MAPDTVSIVALCACNASWRSTGVAINAAATPVLRQEALQAQSATIDTVSGATYTSTGYVQSLQSAIDQARSAGVITTA